jgi:hypothetical protein
MENEASSSKFGKTVPLRANTTTVQIGVELADGGYIFGSVPMAYGELPGGFHHCVAPNSAINCLLTV